MDAIVLFHFNLDNFSMTDCMGGERQLNSHLHVIRFSLLSYLLALNTRLIERIVFDSDEAGSKRKQKPCSRKDHF